MALDIRTLTTEEEVAGWQAAVDTGFLNSPRVGERRARAWASGIDPARTLGAFDGRRCVGALRTFAQEVTVPGGAALPSCAVTNVAVVPTHRRRGLLSRMMARALAGAKERGDAFASLIAAEYPIYGRYGFGPAAWTSEYEVSVARTGLDPRYASPPPGEGGVELIDAAEARRVGPEFHDRWRAGRGRAGAVDRPARWWSRATGELDYEDGFTLPFIAVHRDADGVVQGLATYQADEAWPAKLPQYTLTVRRLTAATPAAERALWYFLLSIDWVQTVRSELRAADDLLPLLLPDPRAARLVAQADFLWLRPLDVPRILGARTYGAPGALVFQVHDAAGLAGGRFRLEGGPDGATCAPSRDDADLSLDIGEIGALCLGDEAVSRLVALGRVDEHRAGAAATADAMLRTARRPWCPDIF